MNSTPKTQPPSTPVGNCHPSRATANSVVCLATWKAVVARCLMLTVRCLDSNEWRLAQGKGPFIRRGRDSGYVWNAGCRKYLSGSVRDCPKIWVGMRDWRTLLGIRETSTNLVINFLNKTDDRPKFKKGLLVKEINGTIWTYRPEGRFHLLYLFERCE